MPRKNQPTCKLCDVEYTAGKFARHVRSQEHQYNLSQKRHKTGRPALANRRRV